MFTGIVEALGEVIAAGGQEPAWITVGCPQVAAGCTQGDSVAVNGVCLTVTSADSVSFSADIMAETLRRSTLGQLAAGSPVNLERPLRLDGRLGGHLVQGHVDSTGTVRERTRGPGWEVLRIAAPPPLMRYVAEKGSIAVDGVSLTVSAAGEDAAGPWFEVSLIPTTLKLTTLGRLQPGAMVNLEADIIAKYVERLASREAKARS
jgi:riboflavin synthase